MITRKCNSDKNALMIVSQGCGKCRCNKGRALVLKMCILVTIIVAIICIGVGVWSNIRGNDVPEYNKEFFANYLEYPEYDVTDYVILGDYHNIEVPSVEIEDVTDADVMAYMENKMPYVSVGDDTICAESGNKVIIDFVGSINGKMLEHTSASNYQLIIGSNTLIENFEQALIGMHTGQQKTFRISFPVDYNDPYLKGQTAEFNVLVKNVSVRAELTDANVASVTNGECATIDAFREKCEVELINKSTAIATSEVEKQVLNDIRNVSEIKGIPEELITWYVNNMMETYEYKARMDGVTLEYYLSTDVDLMRKIGRHVESSDELKAYFEKTAENVLLNELIIDAVAAAENIQVSSDEYAVLLNEWFENSDIHDIRVYEDIQKASNIERNVLSQKVIAFLMESK